MKSKIISTVRFTGSGYEVQKNSYRSLGKNTITYLLAAVLFVTISHAQSSQKIKGNGNLSSKTVTTTDYDKILVSGFFDVNLVSGKEGQITLKGEENLLEFVKVEVHDNALKISTEKGKRISTSMGKTITITVPFESLDEVSLAGSGDINSKSTIKSAQFSASLTGSGDIHLDIDAKDITAKVTGSGDMILKGKTNEFKCDVTGSGDLNASGLESGNVNSTVSGSGNCKVFCTDFLQARVTGSGDIDYSGDPKKKDTKVNGSGSISKV
jgi:hypothetical protein